MAEESKEIIGKGRVKNVRCRRCRHVYKKRLRDLGIHLDSRWWGHKNQRVQENERNFSKPQGHHWHWSVVTVGNQ